MDFLQDRSRRRSRRIVVYLIASIAPFSLASCFGMNKVTSPTTAISVALVAVTVAPPSASVTVGRTVALVATAADASGNVLKDKSVTWSSDNTAKATVNSSGVVTAVAAGTAHITATCDGTSASSSITVTTVPVAAVTISPASASVIVGATRQLSATAKDAGGNTLSGRIVTWSSDNTAKATVNSSGLVTAVAAGSANITATCEGQTGSSSITTVFVPVASVTVSPASASVNVGSTRQLTATPRDASGNTLTGRAIVWSSDNTASATVSSSGLVHGIATGVANISASCESQTGTSAIQVAAPSNSVGLLTCPTFATDNIWNRDISALPAHARSAAWIGTMVQTGDQFHVNLGATNGHVINHTGAGYQTLTFGACADGGEYTGLYPYTPGVTQLQGGDPDHHCIMLDTTACMLYELYGASSTSNDACYGIRWDLSSNQLQQYGKSSADEAGLPIATGLFTYHDLFEAQNITHALRFQCRDIDIDWHDGSWLWPARHTSNPGIAYKPVMIPFGARIRLRADYQPTGAAANDPGFLTLTAAMKRYGAFLGDRGSSTIALSGVMDSRWGSWPDNFMNWSAQWIPYLEVVDESSLMVDPNSGQSR